MQRLTCVHGGMSHENTCNKDSTVELFETTHGKPTCAMISSEMITKQRYILLNMLDAFQDTIIAHSHYFMHANIPIYKRIIFCFTFIFDSIPNLLVAKIA